MGKQEVYILTTVICGRGRASTVVTPTEEDEEALSAVRGALEVLLPSPSAMIQPEAGRRALQVLTELRPLLPELLPGILATGSNPP